MTAEDQEKRIKQTDGVMQTACIKKEDAAYPKALREITDPPRKLFVRGNIDLLNTRCFAVAGSRRATRYGLLAAEMIGKRLAECGITVVSGLAEGIDTAAHRGALSAGGNTIAVLANGLDRYYPSSNSNLQNEIEQKGLLVSEYHDGITAMKRFFPLRNRIISGLSEVVIIAEAALRSGSLITAEAAVEQGRRVFAVPGNFMIEGCAGTNRLIVDGAEELIDINVFLSDMGLQPDMETRVRPDLSSDENEVLDLVMHMGEATTDDLVKGTLKPAGVINGIITVLEIKGLVSMEMGRVFPTVKIL